MNPKPDGSYETPLQEKLSKADAKGKRYQQFSVYLPTEEMRSLGWKKGLKLRIAPATWKDKFGKHSGWIIEPHGRKCVSCGSFNPREADYCMECGASTRKSSACSSVVAAAVGSR